MESRRALFARTIVAAAAVGTVGGAAVGGAATAAAMGDPAAQECRSSAPMPHPFVKIMADRNEFDTDCLSVPPGRDFRVYFNNRDRDVEHNISIYSANPAKDKKAQQFYKGKAFKGWGQEEYGVDALPSGTYYFQDDKVPAMHGQILIPTK